MEIKVGKVVWNKSTKQEFEIIYLNATKREGNSIVVISKGKYQHTDFIHPIEMEANFTDVEPPPFWPPKFKQVVFSIDVVGNVYSFECYEEISLPRIYPTRKAAEHARDKQQLIDELQEFADGKNKGWTRCENGKFRNFGHVIYKSLNDKFYPQMTGNVRFIGDVSFKEYNDVQAAIDHFGHRLELLF